MNRFMKDFLITIGLLATITVAMAQESWIQPDRFFYARGEKISAGFSAGRDFIGQPWLKEGTINSVMLHRMSEASDLLDSIKYGQKENLSHLLQVEGTYLIALQTNNLPRKLPADTFNLVLKEYELDAVKNQRQKANSVTSPATVYQRVFAKLIFQVGEKRDDTYKKVMGWPLEILPDRNPSLLKMGDLIKFKILFDGKPVFGVRAKVWNRYDNRTTLQNIYTQQDGTIEARISSPGPWMVTVMRMDQSTNGSSDWQSYQGSLVFGIEK